MPKEDSKYICLSVILIGSVFRTGKNYYPHVFLEECKYVVKQEKIPKYIMEDIEVSSDSERENCDEENSDKRNSDEKNLKNTNITHILKLIFEAYNKYFL